MGTWQNILYTVVVAVVAAIVAFLCVFIPAVSKRRKPRRYHYDEPAAFDYKKSARAVDDESGSSVDNQNARKQFRD